MRPTALPLRDVDDRERVVQCTGHVGRFAVGRDRQAAGIDAGGDHGRHELGSLAQMIGQNVLAFVGRRLLEQLRQPRQVHDRDPVAARARDQGKGSVGRDGDGGRVWKAFARLVEQDLVDPPIVPDDAQAVGDRPALEQPRHRHQVLGAQQGRHGESPGGMPGHAQEHVGFGDLEPILDHAALGVDDGDLGKRGARETSRTARGRW